MATSFQFYNDPALQILTGTHALNHLVDGSTDPQDFLFYYGSTVSANKAEKNSNPGIDELVVEIFSQVDLWTASVAVVVDDLARTTAKNGFLFKVQSITGTGLTGSAEPVWPLVLGQTVVDNEVTWANDGKIHETTEIKLALTQAGLDSAVAGASLPVGVLVNGGNTNALTVYARVDDATAMIGENGLLNTKLGIIVRDVLEQPK